MEVEAFHLNEMVVVMGPRVILRERRFTVQLVYKDVSRSQNPKGQAKLRNARSNSLSQATHPSIYQQSFQTQ